MSTVIDSGSRIADQASALSQVLREETANAHEHAENSQFMTLLMEGELDVDDVVRLHAQYWAVYRALENAVREVAAKTYAAQVYDARLERTTALENDLRHLLGENWKEEVEILPATKEYVERIEALGKGGSGAIVAHHYVRYLGDISGGQVIARRLGSLYGISSEALQFYDFSVIGKIPPYRKAYREALDALPLSDVERVEIVEEAKRAFGYNSRMFQALHAV